MDKAYGDFSNVLVYNQTLPDCAPPYDDFFSGTFGNPNCFDIIGYYNNLYTQLLSSTGNATGYLNNLPKIL